jgi:hypothetical protein
MPTPESDHAPDLDCDHDRAHGPDHEPDHDHAHGPDHEPDREPGNDRNRDHAP